MLKIITLILVVAIAGVLGYAATEPDTFRYERKIVIKAPPAKIFGILNDPRTGKDWSPWEQMDPAMKKKFSGPATGVGAAMEWDGNKDVGAGRMEITDTSPEKIVQRLDFYKPMKATNTAEFIMTPQGDSTEVTWAMYGANPYLGKVISVFVNCEKMVGEQFEKGLANLKTLAEK